MVITWYGQSCFKIESRGAVLAIDPFGKEIGLTPPRFKADLVLITHAHFDHQNQNAIQGEPFIIDGPGEYEVKGIGVRGVRTFHDSASGKERGVNTVYIINLEDAKICHLGDFGEERLRQDVLEEIGDVDILMVPIGGTYTIDGKQAAFVVSQIEPRVVIPMHYKIPKLGASLAGKESFLKEMGVKEADSLEKFVIKKKDLPEEETKVVVLQPA
ncbi:MAG: MBL fold metallo-hydrolase [Candidatus Sungbacteria bacterium]|nr:MBL fold metallo-hydrolase [Candidatus Sungbacteria bacterium]